MIIRWVKTKEVIALANIKIEKKTLWILFIPLFRISNKESD